MRSCWRAGLVFFSGVFLLCGCGHKVPDGISNADKQAFDSAPPELKEVWLKGLEAFNTNDYATAQNLFYSLLNQELSPAQKQAVANETTIVMNRLYSGAEKGDPDALKALEELRRNPPNRPPR
jgi:hypothetical protein